MEGTVEVTNLRLNGRKELIGDIVQEREEKYLRFKVKEVVAQEVFPLHEATVEQIQELRRSGIPTFVLRDGYQLFFAEINNNVKFNGNYIITRHKCNEGGCCSRLSAAEDIDGGCAKVRSRCKGLERYPWLDFAFEVFNTTTEDRLSIARCDHYEKANRRVKARTTISIEDLAWGAHHGVTEITTTAKKRYEYNFI